MLRSITLQGEGQTEARDLEAMISRRLDDISRLDPSLAVLYTSHMEGDLQALLDVVHQFFPDCQLVGCTTDGELSLQEPSCRDTVQLTFISSETCDMVAGVGRNYSGNPAEAVREAWRQAQSRSEKKPRLALALLDGLTSIESDVAAVLREVAGDVPVVGGTAGDRFLIRETSQFMGREVLHDAVVIVLFCGPVLFSTHNSHGRRPIGPRCSVAQVQGNRVGEIGEEKALDYYAGYLGKNQEEYRQFPLMVHPADGSRPYLCSAGFFNDDGSVSFVGAFPEDVEVQLCEADRHELLAAARESCVKGLEKYPGSRPQLCMIFACASRRHILGTWAGMEMDCLLQGNEVDNAFGFYTYGEIGPDNEHGFVRFHSDTFVTLFLGEED